MVLLVLRYSKLYSPIHFIDLKAGDTFTVNDHEHTLGDKLGKPGSTASVHSVQDHDNIVAKVFHKNGGVAPIDRKKEVSNLEKVGEFHGETETEGGHHVILATKHTGKNLEDTDAWKNADTAAKQKEVKAKASALTIAKNQHHADTHGVVHTCVGFIYHPVIVITYYS
jgi:hypothetical protein